MVALAAALLIAVTVIAIAARPAPEVAEPSAGEGPGVDELLADIEAADSGLRAVPRSGAALSELVPGFRGNLLGFMATPDGAVGWSWASEESDPRLVSLERERAPSWDATGTMLAAIGDRGGEATLFLGTPSRGRDVFTGATSYAWSADGSRRLALLTQERFDGLRHLWRSMSVDTRLRVPAMVSALVVRLDTSEELAAFGDWGFVLADPDHATMTTLDADGAVVAAAPFRFHDAGADGALLVQARDQLFVVGPDLVVTAPIAVGVEGTALLSPRGGWVAYGSCDGRCVELVHEESTLRIDIPITGTLASWSADGRWIAVAGEDGSGPALSMVDVFNGTATSFPVEGRLDHLVVDATGGGTRPLTPGAAEL